LAEEYEKYRFTSYMKVPSPLGRHSIAHQTDTLDTGMIAMIIDPSTFHGYIDSLQPYLDGVRGMGEERVGVEPCDAVEASFMPPTELVSLALQNGPFAAQVASGRACQPRN
jgi:hypothetical protein